jgi:hypothetical protein
LQEKANQIREDLMTPEQKIQAKMKELNEQQGDELRDVNEMQAAGMLTDEEAAAQRKAIKKQFDEQRKALTPKEKTEETFDSVAREVGVSGTTSVTSGFAASMMGGMMAVSTEQQQLNFLKSIAQTNERIAKKDNVGRWA